MNPRGAKVDPGGAQVGPGSAQVDPCSTQEAPEGGQVDPVGAQVQFERLGYFCVDPDTTADLPVFNEIVPLRDTWKKIKTHKADQNSQQA